MTQNQHVALPLSVTTQKGQIYSRRPSTSTSTSPYSFSPKVLNEHDQCDYRIALHCIAFHATFRQFLVYGAWGRMLALIMGRTALPNIPGHLQLPEG